MPKANPAPTIGPIKGEISMAPIITAVELTFNPTQAITMAQARIQRLDPRKETFDLTVSITRNWSSSPFLRFIKSTIFSIMLGNFVSNRQENYFGLRII